MKKTYTNYIIFANENDKKQDMNNIEPGYVYILTNPRFKSIEFDGFRSLNDIISYSRGDG